MTTAIAIATGEVQERARSTEYDSSFASAYETYYTKVFAFVYSRVHNVELAKDIVSGVFERAYQKGHTVRNPAAYSAWIFMIAKNLIANHFRMATREFNNQEKVKYQLRFQDSPPGPEDVVLRDERMGMLTQRIKTLPQRAQELLSLKFDAELTHAEIAKIMGMTPLNVRVSIFRALRCLRDRMSRDEAAAAVA